MLEDGTVDEARGAFRVVLIATGFIGVTVGVGTGTIVPVRLMLGGAPVQYKIEHVLRNYAFG